VTVGGGLNSLTLGTGADSVKITTAGTSGNIYTTITDIAAGDTIDLSGLTTVASANGALGAKLTLADTAGFTDYLKAGAQAVIADAGASTVKWFEFSGNTYIVIDTTVAANTPDDNNDFEDGVDSVVKLTGLVDLSTSTLATDVLTIV
jgi:S-layer protein